MNRSRALRLGLALGVVGAGAAAALAVGLGRSEATTDPWAYAGVPGTEFSPRPVTRQVGATASVDPATMHRVVSIGEGTAQLALVAGRAAGGDLCLAAEVDVGTLGFECFDRLLRVDRAVVVRTNASAPQGGPLASLSLVGVARSDVRRVELSLADGRTIGLPLRRWRSFAYTADEPSEIPVALVALDRDGAALESVPLAPR